MNDQPTIADVMAAYALDAIDLAKERFQQELDFSTSSIQTVESILARYHNSLPRGFFQKLFKKQPTQKTIDLVCRIFGAYVGEVIRKSHGGEWVLDDQISPGNKIAALRKDDMKIWPPTKVHKRIVNGPEDNVWHFFQFVSERWKTTGVEKQ